MLKEGRYGHRDEYEESYPLVDIDKTQVIQESKALFKKSPIHSRKCSFMISKLLYLLSRGEKFTPTEASDIFFNSLNLFVAKDEKLRRLLFVLMKELSPDVEQAFMACNSLFQDMSSNVTRSYRAPAIRVLRKITDADASLFGQLDRHLKQSVVDQDPSVASAALVAGLHLSQANADLVKRWTNEMQSALKSDHHMVQYHALALMYKLRHTDHLAVTRLIFANSSALRSPLAHCMLIRYAATILKEENDRRGERSREILEYLDTCLMFKNDMVTLEACRVLVDLGYLTPKEYTPCVTALQSFLMRSKPVLRFTAVRLLNKLADRYPILVALCNQQLDELMEDDRCSRELRTQAITTLLKTGSESMIEKLVKQINKFMSGLSDDYKVTIIEAMTNLVIKYPRRVNAVMGFFNTSLRDEGGYVFKKAAVEGIMQLMEHIPECKEQGMSNLCEFIEDCEFALLLQQVLHFIGKEGPKMPKPARYVRFVYNRVLLESAPVRANAVITLATFAALCSDLRQSIKVILRRIMYDNDDEVRDRAVFYLKVLETDDDSLIRSLILEELPMNVSSLEKSLSNYLQQGDYQKRFDITTVAEVEKEDEREAQLQAAAVATTSPMSVGTPTAANGGDTTDEAASTVTRSLFTSSSEYMSLFAKVPQLADMGVPRKTVGPIALTDVDDAYVVGCVKHIFTDRIVFQFNCTNKVENTRLENIVVHMDIDHLQGLEEEFAVQVATLAYGSTETAFVIMKRSDMSVGRIKNTLHFASREFDPEDEDEIDDIDEDADEDDFELDELQLRIVDYLQSVTNMNLDDFKQEWEQVGKENEVMHSAELSTRDSLQQCIDNVVAANGLMSLNDTTVGSDKGSHILYFVAETIVDGDEQQPERALLVAKFTKKEGPVVLQTAVRAVSPTLRQQLVGALVPVW